MYTNANTNVHSYLITRRPPNTKPGRDKNASPALNHYCGREGNNSLIVFEFVGTFFLFSNIMLHLVLIIRLTFIFINVYLLFQIVDFNLMISL